MTEAEKIALCAEATRLERVRCIQIVEEMKKDVDEVWAEEETELLQRVIIRIAAD